MGHVDVTAAELHRFLAKIAPPDPHGCRRWTGARNSKGYGCLVLRCRPWLAHRLAHVLWVGPIPDGQTVDHSFAAGCRSRLCLTPEHLEAVSRSENARRGGPRRLGTAWREPVYQLVEVAS